MTGMKGGSGEAVAASRCENPRALDVGKRTCTKEEAP